jgi:hypothetical protein
MHEDDVMSRLATSRNVSVRETEEAHQPVGSLRAAVDIAVPTTPRNLMSHSTLLDSSEYARAIVEIEQAAAALCRAEPALEAWAPDAVPASEPRYRWSVWILIGGVWISTVLVVASAIAVTLYLLG